MGHLYTFAISTAAGYFPSTVRWWYWRRWESYFLMKSGTNVFLTWTKYTLYPSNRSGNMFVPGKYVEFSNKFASGSGNFVVCSSDIRYNGKPIHALNFLFRKWLVITGDAAQLSEFSSPLRQRCQQTAGYTCTRRPIIIPWNIWSSDLA